MFHLKTLQNSSVRIHPPYPKKFENIGFSKHEMTLTMKTSTSVSTENRATEKMYAVSHQHARGGAAAAINAIAPVLNLNFRFVNVFSVHLLFAMDARTRFNADWISIFINPPAPTGITKHS
jgi:hypothetical protein